MAKPIDEQLARRRRRTVFPAMALLAVLIAFATRDLGDWAAFGVALSLLIAFMVFGTSALFGPLVRDSDGVLDEHEPPPSGDPLHGSWRSRRHSGDEQLVLGSHGAGQPARSRHGD